MLSIEEGRFQCWKCKETFKIAEVYSKGNGYYTCKACAKIENAKNYERYKEKTLLYRKTYSKSLRGQEVERNSRYKKRGGSLSEYEKLMLLQEGKCAICAVELEGASGCLDHNHITAQLRGILCRRCNLILGHAQDSTKVLKQAVIYLEKFQTNKINRLTDPIEASLRV